MKTVKIKVRPTPDSLALIPGYLKELEWLWNKCRHVALHNHCLEWYKNAEKKWKVDLSGCVLTPLYFSRHSAWAGASCRIATGGPYWKKDESKVIQYRINKGGKIKILDNGWVVIQGGKWEPRTKHGLKLVEGDRPWEPIKPEPHSYLVMDGVEIKQTSDLDRKGRMSAVRVSEGLPPLSIHSDFIGGLIAGFDAAWDAYKDIALTKRHQPTYKDGKASTVGNLSNGQKPPTYKNGKFTTGGLTVKPVDRSWEERLRGLVPRSSQLVRRPSGWYLCISAALPSEVFKPTLESRKKKAGTAAKKGIVGKAAQAEALANSPEYQAAIAALEENKMQIEIDRYLASPCSKPSDLVAGIDPGVKAIVATDHGALFNPNISRGRIALHIETLQSRLDGMRESNDKRLGASWRMGKREATANEIKLARKVSRLHERGANSSNMFNHKLATRLVRTYGELRWEDTQLGNMSKAVEAKLAEDGSHYEQNGAAAKTGLNYALRHACMGDLKAKVKGRVNGARKIFTDVPAPGSSQNCHACGCTGDRPKQDTFFCLNAECEQYLIKQHADTNAAKNHKKNGEQ
jgi:hypothetical protein